MITKIWRYSHFALAVSSSLFLLLATLTGLVLAFEPIQNNLQPFKVAQSEHLPLGPLIDTLRAQYDEVLEVEINADQFVKASVISMDEELDGDFYIHPATGQKIGDIPERSGFFEFMTNLHRSLFLKTIGRIFVGVTSFLLLLIAITGFLLFLQRQQGIRYLFSRIVKEDTAQFYHVFLGRLMLLPVIIVAGSGVYLSFLRFSIIPTAVPVTEQNLVDSTATAPLSFSEFAVFRETRLGEVRKLEFPFSTDEEDYFILSLKDREVSINQKTGAIVETRRYPLINQVSDLTFNLHTGTGSIGWSVVLALAAINILYFMYSGTIISYKRLRSRIRNKFGADEAEIVILVGSENGSTKTFGGLLQKALLDHKKKVFVDELNKYQAYPKMDHLVVLTSTYGDGDPPANAVDFFHLLQQNPPARPLKFSVVGFGSLAYPNFCQYAVEADAQLRQLEHTSPVQEPFLIHNKSYTSFKSWAQQWGEQLGLKLILPTQLVTKKAKLHSLEVINKQRIVDNYSDTFLLELQANRNGFQSGDLLGITPPDDPVERLYSIAQLDKKKILLSVKRHEFGLCSNYLSALEPGSTIKAAIQINKDFHFPAGAKSVTCISNGTGIAPFLGMMHAGKTTIPIELYWGGRTFQSYELYQQRIDQAIANGKLKACHTVFSREDTPHNYVQELVRRDGRRITEQLKAGGAIMICGSVTMQNGVLAVLEQACMEYLNEPLDVFRQHGQLLMDCY